MLNWHLNPCKSKEKILNKIIAYFMVKESYDIHGSNQTVHYEISTKHISKKRWWNAISNDFLNIYENLSSGRYQVHSYRLLKSNKNHLYSYTN